MQARGQRAELEKIIKRKVLANGLEVIVVENHGVPLATVEVNVKNGSFTQPPEYAGLAHMYEHMFFRANSKYPEPEPILGPRIGSGSRLQRIHAGRACELLHDRPGRKARRCASSFWHQRIRAPLFRQDELERERQVVIGEYDRNESSPFFALQREMDLKLYPGNFSRKNTIGDRQNIPDDDARENEDDPEQVLRSQQLGADRLRGCEPRARFSRLPSESWARGVAEPIHS